MAKRKERDTFERVNFSALGEEIVRQAKIILHEKHLAGEMDPSWTLALQESQKIVVPRFMNVKQEKGEHVNGSK